jgi:hypothetical protein
MPGHVSFQAIELGWFKACGAFVKRSFGTSDELLSVQSDEVRYRRGLLTKEFSLALHRSLRSLRSLAHTGPH